MANGGNHSTVECSSKWAKDIPAGRMVCSVSLPVVPYAAIYWLIRGSGTIHLSQIN